MNLPQVAPVSRPVVQLPVAPPPELNGRGPGQPPAEESFDIREALGVVRRHWLLIALICLVTTGLAGYLAYTRPHQYRSAAVVRMVDIRGSLTGGLNAPVAGGGLGGRRDALLSQMQIMHSRSLMGTVVDREGLRLRAPQEPAVASLLRDVTVPEAVESDTFRLVFHPREVEVVHGGRRTRAAYGAPAQAGAVRFTVERAPTTTREATVTVLSRDAAISSLAGGLETKERTNTDLFDVSYTAGDRYTAQRVLAGVVAGFQARNAEQAQQESRRRRIFLEQQLLETDSVLTDAQLALSMFRQNQAVFSTRDEYGTQQAGATDLEARREELEAERQSSRTLLAAVERGGVDARSLGALVSSPSIAGNPVIVRLYNQLSDYQTARDTLTTGQFRASAESPEVQRLNVLITGTEQRIADAVRSQVSSLDARIGSLDNLLSRREGRIQRLPGVEMEEVRLTQQVTATQTVADQLRAELQRARISEAVEVGQVEVVDPATLPGLPVPQNRPLRILVGLVMGLALGAGAALLREQMNTSIQRREELESLLNASTLAVIPGLGTGGERRSRLWRLGRRAALADAGAGLAALDPRAPVSEAYRTLRTNLLFSRTTRPRTLVVTSAGPAEGKTTTSSNLAATFAQQGMTVVLVDCDLRRPRVHEIFAAEREPGLTQWMLGYCSAAEALRDTSVERLTVLPAGTLPPNPSELLGSGQMGDVLRELQSRYDLVILDTPPVLLAPDASVLAAGADGVLLVVRAGVTERNAAREAAQQLAKVGAQVIGGVLNDPEGKTQHGYQAYYSYHRYGYGPAAQ